MKITALLAGVGACLAMAEAGKSTIFANKVEPFPEPDKDKGTFLTALEFKPSLNFIGECPPYPAVDEGGLTSKGLPKDVHCHEDAFKPMKKSQVYTRGRWHEGRWCQMYVWNFPVSGGGTIWLNVVLWLNNPDANHQAILAVSFSNGDKDKGDGTDLYNSETPPEKDVVVKGSTVRVKYANGGLSAGRVPGGHFQDLITWEGLSPLAREHLNDPSSFNGVQAPFNDHKFYDNIKKAWKSTKL